MKKKYLSVIVSFSAMSALAQHAQQLSGEAGKHQHVLNQVTVQDIPGQNKVNAAASKWISYYNVLVILG